MAKFGPDHPAWSKLVSMRREGVLIKDCLKYAHGRGYTNLTYENLRSGFANAANAFALPSRSSTWLRKKHARVAQMVDSLETMQFVMMELVEDWEQVKEDLANPTHTAEYRKELRTRSDKIMSNIFNYSERITNMKFKLTELARERDSEDAGQGVALMTVDLVQMEKLVNTVMERFRGQVTERTGQDDPTRAAAMLVGADNVRDVGQQPEKGEEEVEEEV